MSDNSHASPGFSKNPGYVIELLRSSRRVRVVFNGATIADSENVLLMREQNHAPVCYFPLPDVALKHLQRTDHATHCPYKGEASYWTVSVAGRTEDNAVWGYETPYDEVADIKGHVAFYRGRMDGWFEDGEPVLGQAH
ncbi:MAG: DUF427 domain-containing protein [Alphaproteobacteria bacterium]